VGHNTQLPTSQDSVPVLPAPRGRIRLTQASIILPTTNPVSLWQWYINRHSSWLAVQFTSISHWSFGLQDCL